MFCITSVLLNFLICFFVVFFFYGQHMSVFVDIPCILEKKCIIVGYSSIMCSFAIYGIALYIVIRSSWLMFLFKSSVDSFSVYFFALITERRGLKSPTISMVLLISPSSSIRFWFIYLETVR